MIKDIMIDDNAEIVMQGRDMAVADAGEQVCDLLVTSCQGEWKNSPLSGWALQAMKNAPKEAVQRLKPQMMEDLARNSLKAKITIDNDNINIDIER